MTGAGAAPVARPQVSLPLLVVATFYCEPRRGAPYHEVHLAPREIRAPASLIVAHSHLCSCEVLVTRDVAVYADALDAEGTPHRVVAHYHRTGTHKVLDSLDVLP